MKKETKQLIKILAFIFIFMILMVGMLSYFHNYIDRKVIGWKTLLILFIISYGVYELILIWRGCSLIKDPWEERSSFIDFLWDNIGVLVAAVITTFGLLGLKDIPKNIYKLLGFVYHGIMFVYHGIINVIKLLYGLITAIFNKWVLIILGIAVLVILIKYGFYLIFKVREELRIQNEKIKKKTKK